MRSFSVFELLEFPSVSADNFVIRFSGTTYWGSSSAAVVVRVSAVTSTIEAISTFTVLTCSAPAITPLLSASRWLSRFSVSFSSTALVVAWTIVSEYVCSISSSLTPKAGKFRTSDSMRVCSMAGLSNPLVATAVVKLLSMVGSPLSTDFNGSSGNASA